MRGGVHVQVTDIAARLFPVDYLGDIAKRAGRVTNADGCRGKVCDLPAVRGRWAR